MPDSTGLFQTKEETQAFKEKMGLNSRHVNDAPKRVKTGGRKKGSVNKEPILKNNDNLSSKELLALEKDVVTSLKDKSIPVKEGLQLLREINKTKELNISRSKSKYEHRVLIIEPDIFKRTESVEKSLDKLEVNSIVVDDKRVEGVNIKTIEANSDVACNEGNKLSTDLSTVNTIVTA